MRPLVPFLSLLSVCALALPACGGDAKSEDGNERRSRGGVQRNVDPAPGESVDDAIDRIRGAATASGCEAVRGLLHSSYGDISEPACEAVKTQIDGFRDPSGAGYKTGAAIDFETSAGQHRLIALALDGDRTYRIALVADVPDAAVGTSKPAVFDRNAVAVVNALRSGDCDAFLRLVSRTMGLGVGPDPEVCRRASDVPFRRELLANRGARPVPLGGNGEVAFYKLRTRPDAYYTLVMARERPSGGGALRYVLVTALPAGI